MLGPSVHNCRESLGICSRDELVVYFLQRPLVPDKGGLSVLGPFVHDCSESLGFCLRSTTLSNCKEETLRDNK